MTVDNVNTSHGQSLLNAVIPVPVPRGGSCVKNQYGTKSASRQWHHRGRKAGIIAKTDDVEVVQWQDSPELNAIGCNVLVLCWFEGCTSNAYGLDRTSPRRAGDSMNIVQQVGKGETIPAISMLS